MWVGKWLRVAVKKWNIRSVHVYITSKAAVVWLSTLFSSVIILLSKRSISEGY